MMIVVVDEKRDLVSFNGLSWDQIFYLDAVLLSSRACLKIPKFLKINEELLQACEAAQKRIINEID